MDDAKAFKKEKTVHIYREMTALQPVETYVFRKYVPAGARVLDLGIGAGRTTRYLAPHAKRYVGIDISEPMVRAARETFPGIELGVGDAADLSRFSDASFDRVVFSFNGMGYISPRARIEQTLREIRRVLRPEGVFIFSLHHSQQWLQPVIWQGADPLRKVWRVLLALRWLTVLWIARLFSGHFWKTEGYRWDPVHGGTRPYCTTPNDMKRMLDQAGFDTVEVVSSEYPENESPAFTRWYYYVARSRAAAMSAARTTAGKTTPVPAAG